MPLLLGWSLFDASSAYQNKLLWHCALFKASSMSSHEVLTAYKLSKVQLLLLKRRVTPGVMSFECRNLKLTISTQINEGVYVEASDGHLPSASPATRFRILIFTTLRFGGRKISHNEITKLTGYRALTACRPRMWLRKNHVFGWHWLIFGPILIIFIFWSSVKQELSNLKNLHA